MHDTVFYVAAAWMAGLMAACVLVVLRARSVMTRILALDMVTLILIAFLILYADARRAPYYLHAAIALALLSFAGTIAASHFHAKGRFL
jgi:multicomponent Na+:H+ antiporter subunit F